MNYKRIYDQLITLAKRRDIPKGYSKKYRKHGYDIHHIVAKSLGGTDEPENLVYLTYKEHYLAHHLLAKYAGDKMRYAFFRMSHNTKKYKTTSSQMSDARKLKSLTTFTKEARKKMSERQIIPVVGFNLETGDKIVILGGQQEMKLRGFNPSHIHECCSGKLAKSQGYVWMRKTVSDVMGESDIRNVIALANISQKKTELIKPLIMKCIKTERETILNGGIAEAVEMGYNKGHVSSCCNGKRKTHKGFYWRFV